MTRERADIVIIGAGFAGASTAAALARRGVSSVRILEAEAIPGRHGTGRNAAMARRVIEHPALAKLATRSLRAMAELEARRGTRLLSRVGGLLLGTEEAIAELAAAARAVPELARDVEVLTMAAAAERVPVLSGASAEAALWSPGCGVADIHALLDALLAEAREGGARLSVSTRVTGVRRRGDRVIGVDTDRGPIDCEVLVNAAGFEVAPIAELADAAPPPVQPTRRHLFVSAPWQGLDPSWPFVWDVSAGYYFRPEGRGLLMCACDETPWPPVEPTMDPNVRERLAEVFATHVPALCEARPAHAWAGSRVLTPDGGFVMGPDPEVQGLFWVAGLGGHGMTTSVAVGEIAAEGLLEGALPEPYSRAFAPDRLRRTPGTAGVPSG